MKMMGDNVGAFVQMAMHISHYYFAVLLTVIAIGIISWFIRCLERGHSSWPTWLLILTTILLLVMIFRLTDPLWFFELGVFVIVFARWMFALLRREKSYGWAFYLVTLIAAETLVYPDARWISDKL